MMFVSTARSTLILVALCCALSVTAFQAPLPKNGGSPISSKTVAKSSTTIDSFVVAPPVLRSPVTSPMEDTGAVSDEVPMQGAIMKMLPKQAFKVSTKTSLAYFGIDFVAVAATMGFLNAVVNSDLYHSLAMWQQALMVAPLQVLTGFAMWAMWCIGHDAGHSLISKSKPWLNDLVGEMAHSMICLTPFVPWQLSHRQHHLNHNHLSRDYSHQWFVREDKDQLENWIQWSYLTRNFQLPVLYLVYLLVGVPDGGHVFFYGKLWEKATLQVKARAAISSMVSLATAGSLWHAMGTANFAVVCFAPWTVMGFWLFMVTYLQHHSEDGKLYTDESWTFQKGAFETVDRSYGKWVDRMSHHMMDGHVVHHLFFERVPHYRLEEATKKLVEGLEKENKEHLYKNIETPKFTQEILKQFNENWFFVDRDQIVRK
jgi:acyl-lipid omega-3 desaturase